jgi:hypothetical protein
MDNVDQFSLKELFIIASFLEVDEMIVLNLVLQQHAANKTTTG